VTVLDVLARNRCCAFWPRSTCRPRSGFSGRGCTTACTLASAGRFLCRVFGQGGRYVVARGDIVGVLGLTDTAPVVGPARRDEGR